MLNLVIQNQQLVREDNMQEATLLIYHMLDELALELGYENGIQDLIDEEEATNVELLQVVEERLLAQLELHEQEVNKAYS